MYYTNLLNASPWRDADGQNRFVPVHVEEEKVVVKMAATGQVQAPSLAIQPSHSILHCADQRLEAQAGLPGHIWTKESRNSRTYHGHNVINVFSVDTHGTHDAQATHDTYATPVTHNTRHTYITHDTQDI